MDGVRTARIPARALTVVFGLILVAMLGAGALTIGAGARGEPPESITERELLSRVSAVPESAPDFSATVTVEQTLVPEGLLGASEGGDTGDTGDSGPRAARVWRGGPDRLRAELQGENGDRVLVRNGDLVSIYDGASNTLKTGEKPGGAADGADALPGASLEEIDEHLARIAPSSKLEAGEPVEVAGRWAYPLTLEPRDKSATLIERAEALVDAETFVPLLLELYAEGRPEPVARYEVRDFQVGPIPEARFEFETPPDATVERLEPKDDRAGRYRGGEEPRKVASVEEASELAGFTVQALPEAPGGRELEKIVVAGDGALLTYGSDWGTVILAQKAGGERGAGSSVGAEIQRGGLQVPVVDLGGVPARELSTPVGTVLSWSDGGVSYTLAGSVPAAELRGAARGLLAR